MQTSPRVDVDEVPGADLLHATELVDIHDSIKLLNSDDNPGLLTWYVFCSVDHRSHHESIRDRHSSLRELGIPWTL